MKISGSEVMFVVVLVLIGFVLYTQTTGGTMKTTSIKKVGGKHVQDVVCSNFVSYDSATGKYSDKPPFNNRDDYLKCNKFETQTKECDHDSDSNNCYNGTWLKKYPTGKDENGYGYNLQCGWNLSKEDYEKWIKHNDPEGKLNYEVEKISGYKDFYPDSYTIKDGVCRKF